MERGGGGWRETAREVIEREQERGGGGKDGGKISRSSLVSCIVWCALWKAERELRTP